MPLAFLLLRSLLNLVLGLRDGCHLEGLQQCKHNATRRELVRRGAMVGSELGAVPA